MDDDHGVLRIVARALRLRGHRPFVASRGETAFDLLRVHEVDVVLMDVRMPSMSGRTLFDGIASQWPHLAARTVVMSGDSDARVHEEWLSRSGLPVITKPFELSDLFALVERVPADERRQAKGS